MSLTSDPNDPRLTRGVNDAPVSQSEVRTIWKIRLDDPEQTVYLPPASKVLTVATQAGSPCLWVEVDPRRQPVVARRFYSFGTGHPLPLGVTYLGTAHDVAGEGLVFHIYERTAL